MALGLANNLRQYNQTPMRHNNQRQKTRRGLEYVIPPTKWGQPFVVEVVYSSGAYRLANPNGDTLLMPINDKCYHDHVNTIPLIKEVLCVIMLTLHLWSSSRTHLTVSSPQGVPFHMWNQFQPSLHSSFGKSIRLHDDLKWVEFIEEGSWCILAGPF